MKRLRILIFLGGHISSQAQVHLPNELRWLEWSNAPNLEFGSGPNKLVGLDVRKSHIKQLVGNFQNFRKLKSINFSRCNFLVSIPDLSPAPNMEKLTLHGCESLVEVHPSIGDLVKLKVLSLEWCSNLRNFPNMLKTKSLQTLVLCGCSKLEKFPDIDGKMEHLKILDLRGTAIKELPASIENLVSVESMNLAFCDNLTRLPSHIYKLKDLEYFNLEGCSNLITFPKNMEDSTDPDGYLGFQRLSYLVLCGCNLSEVEFLESFSSFPELRHLHLENNKFAGLPTCINKYYRLSSLYVEGCELLQEIPQLPPNIKTLLADRCKSLQKLPDLWGQLSQIERVCLASCCELFRKGVNMDDVANVSLLEKLPKMEDDVDIVLVGREMPKWILPCEEDSISSMVPPDLCDKFKGLALCAVLSPEEGKVIRSCDLTVLVNGQRVIKCTKVFSVESDHVWLRCWLKGFKDRLPKDWSHFQVFFEAEQGSIKKYGFHLIFEQKEDDPRVVFLAPAADGSNVNVFSEDSGEDNSLDTKEEDTPLETDEEESSSPLTKKIRRS